VLVPMYRQYLTHTAEQYVAQRYNAPYGQAHYFDGRLASYALLKDD